MAFDLEQENARHAAGWHGFVVFSTISVIAIAMTLGLLAAALL